MVVDSTNVEVKNYRDPTKYPRRLSKEQGYLGEGLGEERSKSWDQRTAKADLLQKFWNPKTANPPTDLPSAHPSIQPASLTRQELGKTAGRKPSESSTFR